MTYGNIQSVSKEMGSLDRKSNTVMKDSRPKEIIAFVQYVNAAQLLLQQAENGFLFLY